MILKKGLTYLICAGARFCVALTFIVLAIYNYIKLSEFSEYANTIFFIPYSIRRLVPILIPVGEVALTMGLLFSNRKRTWAALTYYILLLFTVYLIYAIINPWDPQCNCSGLLRLAKEVKDKNIFYLIRNIFLIVLIAIVHFENKLETKDIDE